MQNWEYNYLVFKLENGRSIKDTIRLDQLNQAGDEGWELVGINPLGSSFLMYTFKRPVQPGLNRATPKNVPARNEKADVKPRTGSLRDIRVEQPQQPDYQPQPDPQQGFNIQDILNSILGGEGKF